MHRRTFLSGITLVTGTYAVGAETVFAGTARSTPDVKRRPDHETSSGIREVKWIDCPGGGQVFVDGNIVYIAHMKGPTAITILDVKDPYNPKQLAIVPNPHKEMHSHKVQVRNGIMIINYERLRSAEQRPDGVRGGLKIYDVSRPDRPKLIKVWECDGRGSHRFTYDGLFVYASPEIEGYDGNICLILDMEDPSNPREVSRWHAPGQWLAGGEEYQDRQPGSVVRCHHSIRYGDRLYVSYWHGGWYILDISDISNPRKVSGMDWSPPFPWPTHTCLPIPFEVNGRKIMLVSDEDADKLFPSGPSFLWVVDITDESNPMPFSSYQVPGVDGNQDAPDFIGCHQPVEQVRGTQIPVAWFSYGLRIVDISNPHRVNEVAHYVPRPYPGTKMAQTNDVYEDERGLIYVIDRIGGLNIVERV